MSDNKSKKASKALRDHLAAIKKTKGKKEADAMRGLLAAVEKIHHDCVLGHRKSVNPVTACDEALAAYYKAGGGGGARILSVRPRR